MKTRTWIRRSLGVAIVGLVVFLGYEFFRTRTAGQGMARVGQCALVDATFSSSRLPDMADDHDAWEVHVDCCHLGSEGVTFECEGVSAAGIAEDGSAVAVSADAASGRFEPGQGRLEGNVVAEVGESILRTATLEFDAKRKRAWNQVPVFLVQDGISIEGEGIVLRAGPKMVRVNDARTILNDTNEVGGL